MRVPSCVCCARLTELILRSGNKRSSHSTSTSNEPLMIVSKNLFGLALLVFRCVARLNEESLITLITATCLCDAHIELQRTSCLCCPNVNHSAQEVLYCGQSSLQIACVCRGKRFGEATSTGCRKISADSELHTKFFTADRAHANSLCVPWETLRRERETHRTQLPPPFDTSGDCLQTGSQRFALLCRGPLCCFVKRCRRGLEN